MQLMDELHDLLARLVSIDSVNPRLVPGASGESTIGSCVAEWLGARGLEVRLQDTTEAGRRNVIAIARGTGGGRSLMLNAHMDTVGVTGMEAPFRPEIRGGRLYGRGAMDTKGALAAFMMAAADAAAARADGKRRRGDVILTAVVDEEYASIGTEAVVREYRADAAIVGEPTGLRIVTEHKGFAWFDIETSGVAAHGSLPDVGVDAIVAMGKVLVELEAESRRLAAGRRHPTLGAASVHASLVAGGQELSSYPAACRLSLERRTLPGETAQSVESELRTLLDRIGAADPKFRATMRCTFVRNPMEADRASAIVAALSANLARRTGSPAVFAGESGWLDSSLLDGAGIQTVVIGPRGAGLHGVEEWVELDSVRTCQEVVTGAIDDFCQ